MALRTSLAVQPHLYMGDTAGRPLDGGKVYFGKPNKDPEFYPINIFYDERLTIAAPQPVRTKGGFMNANGNMTEVYAAETRYSVKVLDSYGRQVFYKPDMQSGLDVSDEVDVIDVLPLLLTPASGTKVYVKSVEKNFIFTTTPTSPINTGTVIQGMGGVWEMEIQSSYYASWFCPSSSIDNINEPQEDNINAGYRYATSKGRPFIIDKDYYVKSKKHEGSQAYPSISTEKSGALWYAIRALKNSVLAFQGGSKLKLVPKGDGFSAIIMTFDVENCIILDPHTVGDRDTHLVTTGEQDINMHFGACKNVYVRNPICENSWGDGMYFGFAFYCKPTIGVIVPTDVVIDNPRLTNISRNGVSLCGAENLTINNLYVEDVNRVAPLAGVDIEPEEDINFTEKMFIKNAVFNNSTFVGCGYAISQNIFGNRDVEVSFPGTTLIKNVGTKSSWIPMLLQSKYLPDNTELNYRQNGFLNIDHVIVDDTKGDLAFQYLMQVNIPENSIKVNIRKYEFTSSNYLPKIALLNDGVVSKKSSGFSVDRFIFNRQINQVSLEYSVPSSTKVKINYNLGFDDTVQIVYRGRGIEFYGECYIGGWDLVNEPVWSEKQLINNVFFTPANDGAGTITSYGTVTNKNREVFYSLSPKGSDHSLGLTVVSEGFTKRSTTDGASIRLVNMGYPVGTKVKSMYGNWIR